MIKIYKQKKYKIRSSKQSFNCKFINIFMPFTNMVSDETINIC